jgi:ABC-type spermidine/putrescine transport system permease subunit II
MTAEPNQIKSQSLTKVNRLAVVSIICAAIALAGTFSFGVVVIAVFAVGAGHVSLQQINARHERGAILAYIALGVSYLIATVALFQALFLALAFG